MTSSSRVWFITGASSGFGRNMAEFVLQKGDNVIATARRPSLLDDLVAQYPTERLLVLSLDVTQQQQVIDAFSRAKASFGRIDVVVNNAGVTNLGELESVAEEKAKIIMDTNFWGAVYVTREAVKVFRESNPPGVGGRLLQISSIAALVGTPGRAFYTASKHALNGLTESVAAEIDPAWNIKITLIEPGSFDTELIRKTTFSNPHPAYDNPDLPFTRLRESWSTRVGRGDSRKAVQAFYKLADLKDPPLHFIVGVDANEMARKKLADLQASLDLYESWSVGLDRDA
ncbi:NAD-P-binding protein [Polyporus arcularius HHB13444]|uniref:NAD-P-binding protein n=1 Tax=Polyporus arcularius HHB13444 TaxID=1314778 RepID=A0A5C3P5S9_9APHY|nr:NAD-P-binding protein [Polyporus arcularius HHB13444]